MAGQIRGKVERGSRLRLADGFCAREAGDEGCGAAEAGFDLEARGLRFAKRAEVIDQGCVDIMSKPQTFPSAVRPRKNRGAAAPPGSLTARRRPASSRVNSASTWRRIKSLALIMRNPLSLPVKSNARPSFGRFVSHQVSVSPDKRRHSLESYMELPGKA